MDKLNLKEYISGLKPAHYRWIKTQNPEAYNFILELTSFLDDKVPMKERIYCIMNDIDSHPLCVQCNTNKVSYDYKGKAGYKRYCSNKCMANDPTTKDKIKKTTQDKYGVDHIFQSKDIRNKIEETNKERYGASSYLSTEESQSKKKKRMIEKYGTEHYLQSEKGQKQYKETCTELYGVEHYSKTDEYKEKTKQTCLDNNGVEHNFQLENVKEKIKKTNLERYGVEYPSQSNIIRKKINETFMKNYGCDNFTKRNYSSLTIEKLNDVEWLKTQHHNNKKSLKKIGIELNVCDVTVGSYFNKHGIDVNKTYSVSQAEKEISDFIKQHYTKDIIENDRTIISPLELDIVIPELKLAIEYCGLYWHSNVYKDRYYHLNKLNKCNEEGYRLITIFEDEWVHNKDIYKSKILNIMGLDSSYRIYARDTIVKDISKEERKEFLNQYHIQGDTSSSINYGLFYNDTMVSVMSFKTRSEGIYELVRFASSCNVVGAFGKLLKSFTRNNEWNEIISFADRRWSEGDVYFKNGFGCVKETSPDYRYIIGNERKHKFGFRHNKLKDILENYDPSLSEFENTEKHGIHRIYDCGLFKFSLTNDSL